MKPDDMLTILLRFFNDIIGSLVPGAVFLIGIGIIFPGATQFLQTHFDIDSTQRIWIFIMFAFVIGHGITSLGYWIVIPSVDHILQATRFISDILVKHSKYLNLSKVFPPSLESEDEWSKKYIDSPEYKFLSRRMPQDLINDVEKINTSKIKIHFMRNIAMSIEGLDRDLIYRFMFLSLLNLGIATVSLLLLLIWWLAYYLSHDVVMTIEYRPWYLIVMIFIFLLFIDRSYNFYKRAMITPFSMAVEYFRRDCSNYQELKKNISIYLAGGFKSSWQDSISNQFPDIRFLDPRSHKLTDPIEYTNWDLQAIRESHIIFAYLEKDNPGGYALALEVGYAKALGKHIIFIDEKTIPNSESSRYYDMIRASASVLCSTLEDGKSYLENYLKIYNKL